MSLGRDGAFIFSQRPSDSMLTLPSGRVVSYERDGLQRLQTIRTTVNGQSVTLVDHIQYRADNRMTQCTFGNGLVDDRDYDLQGRLLTQTLSGAGVVDQRSYEYDLNGNVRLRNTTPQDYNNDYDTRDRLITDLLTDGSTSGFDYDLNDNRLLRSGDVQETYVYTAGSNRIKRLESQSSSVALPSVDREFVYNDANRLKEVWDAGTLTGSYIYNAQGQRTRKTTDQGTTVYHYDLQEGLLIAETQADGSLIREYIWKGGEPIAQIEVSGGVEILVYLHTDHLMTPRLATDVSGVVVWRWEGEAFGESATQEDPDGNGVLTRVNLRFPGQYFDSESGLVQNWFREYDPTTGRYIESDPIGLDGGVNTYNYSENNSIRYIDPYGLIYEGDKLAMNPPRFPFHLGVGGFVTAHFMMAGGSFSVELVGGTDGPACIFATLCGRIGPGAYLAIGGNVPLGINSGSTPNDLTGFSVGAGGDLGFGKTLGAGADVGINKDGITSFGTAKGSGRVGFGELVLF